MASAANRSSINSCTSIRAAGRDSSTTQPVTKFLSAASRTPRKFGLVVAKKKATATAVMRSASAIDFEISRCTSLERDLLFMFGGGCSLLAEVRLSTGNFGQRKRAVYPPLSQSDARLALKAASHFD